MELRIFFIHLISYILVFGLIPLRKANYDAQQAIKLKKMDLEYGEKLTTSMARDDPQHKLNSKKFKPLKLKMDHLKPTPHDFLGPVSPDHLIKVVSLEHNDKGTPAPKKPPLTRCTTPKPLPRLPKNFVLCSSNEEHENYISTDEGSNEKNNNKYLAPEAGHRPQYYIDDE